MRSMGSPRELEQRRYRALALLQKGLSPVEVAQRLGVDRRSVRRWKSAARRLQRRPSLLRSFLRHSPPFLRLK